MEHVAAIVNGTAGGGRCARRFEAVRDQLQRSFTVDVRHTTGPGHGSVLARMAVDAGAEAVIAVGGDGTLHEVVNGLLPDPGAALAILPLGTGNSFARDFGVHEPDAAVQALLSRRTRRCDAVRLTHSEGTLYFANLLSLGFAARAGSLTNRRFKPLGAAGYIAAVLACLVRLQHDGFPHRLDDRALDAEPRTLLSFCNSRYTGGDMMMAPEAVVDDGLLDVVRIGPLGRRRFLRAFPRIFKGTHGAVPEISFDRASRVRFEGVGTCHVMLDGEVLQLEPLELEVLPGALEVVA